MTAPAVPRRPVRVRDLWAIPFVIVRVPLYAVDRHVVHRLDPRSRVRLVFDAALGTADILAGHLLGEDAITHHGMGRVRATRTT